MTKLIMALGGAGLAALATMLAVALADGGQTTASVETLPPPATVSAPTGPSGADDRAADEVGEDVSGPCDEAEHANDPRCTGTSTQPRAADEVGEDVSGPCDEAEHAADPQCTGTSTQPRADDDGPTHDADDDDDDHEDRSGHGGHGGDDDSSGSSSGRG